MNNTIQEEYVFKNLIEASNQGNLNGAIGRIDPDVASPCENSNACGVVRQMSFENIGARAAQFGVRFKAASVEGE